MAKRLFEKISNFKMGDKKTAFRKDINLSIPVYI